MPYLSHFYTFFFEDLLFSWIFSSSVIGGAKYRSEKTTSPRSLLFFPNGIWRRWFRFGKMIVVLHYQNDPTISSIILDEEEVKAKELEKELARKNSVFDDEDQGIGSSDEGQEIWVPSSFMILRNWPSRSSNFQKATRGHWVEGRRGA